VENEVLSIYAKSSSLRSDTVEIITKAGIENVIVYQSPKTAHEWLTWRRSLHKFAPLEK
jgi:hypothetical protein